jgi:hypothetical protein
MTEAAAPPETIADDDLCPVCAVRVVQRPCGLITGRYVNYCYSYL